jgi:hypothetical protein
MEKNFQRDNYNNSPSLHNLRNRRVQQITSNGAVRIFRLYYLYFTLNKKLY